MYLSPATPRPGFVDDEQGAETPDDSLMAGNILRQAQSGPTTPSGSREKQMPLLWESSDTIVPQPPMTALLLSGEGSLDDDAYVKDDFSERHNSFATSEDSDIDGEIASRLSLDFGEN